MGNKLQNPLMPLHSVQLTEDEKLDMWNNIRGAIEEEHVAPEHMRRNAPKTPKRKKRWILSGALIVAGTLALVGYTNPQILNIGATFNLLESRLFSPPEVMKAERLGYGQKVNQSVTSSGITLKIGNLYADPTKLEFDMVESFKTGSIRRPVIEDQDFSMNINGTRKLTGFSGGEFSRASGGRFAGIIYFPVMNDQPYRPLPDHFKLNIQVHKIGNITGNWSFSIPVSLQKLKNQTEQLHPNASVSHPNYQLKVTKLDASPVQTIMQCTLTLPSSAMVPPQMEVIDDQGHLLGLPLVHQTTMTSTNGSKTIHMILITGAPSKDAKALTITPLKNYTSPPVHLSGHYPATMTVLPGLHATITGVTYQSNKTVVRVLMDQAKYKSMSTLQGKITAGQFWLVANSDHVGSQTLKFDSPTSDHAEITFGRVDRSQLWSIETAMMQPQTALALTVPLK